MLTDIFNTDKKYSIIYADPPWTYPKTGGIKHSRGMAKSHYATMKLEEIEALPVKNIVSDNCILFMWCTYPQLENGLKVINTWGFKYFGLGFNWIKKTSHGKDFVGMGYWARANPEPCLMAIKGKMKPQRHDIRQIIYAPIGKHSVKPPIVREKIIALAGDLPRIELFAREQFPGWDAWGNEIEIGGDNNA